MVLLLSEKRYCFLLLNTFLFSCYQIIISFKCSNGLYQLEAFIGGSVCLLRDTYLRSKKETFILLLFTKESQRKHLT